MFKFKHEALETNTGLLLVATMMAISIGGLVEIAPLFLIEDTTEKVEGVRPYTPLEQMGRDIFIREGCYTCHSQMVRPSVTSSSAMATTRWRRSRSTTIPSSGAQNARDPTSPGWVASTRTNGMYNT